MEYLLIASLFLGAAIGGGACWLYWQRRLQQAELSQEEAQASFRKSLNEMMEKNGKLEDEVFAGKKEVEKREAELAAAGRRIADLAEELRLSNQQLRTMLQQVQDAERRLHQDEMERARIPGLEKELAAGAEEIARLRQTISGLEQERSRLEQELAEERDSLDQSVIFVQGSHYLPGRVVRNLMTNK